MRRQGILERWVGIGMLNDEVSEGAAEVKGLEYGVGVAREMERGYVSNGGGGKEWETDQVFPNYEKLMRRNGGEEGYTYVF